MQSDNRYVQIVNVTDEVLSMVEQSQHKLRYNNTQFKA